MVQQIVLECNPGEHPLNPLRRLSLSRRAGRNRAGYRPQAQLIEVCPLLLVR